MTRNPLFAIEHSQWAYRADFALYGATSLSLGGWLLLTVPPGQRGSTAAFALAGALSWSLIEYALHRFVLHGLRPFSRWHAEHHSRPTALICAPTLLSAALILTLVFLPVLALGGPWPACGVSLGLITGYLAYAITHHATHHWRTDAAWLLQRKRWHALHHCASRRPSQFGVTTALWDHVFGTAQAGG